MNRASILQQVATGNPVILNRLYKEYRPQFVQWLGKKYGCEEELAVDLFQEAMVIFYENVMNGKLEKLTSSLKTYLFAIGRNLFTSRPKKDRQENVLATHDLLNTKGLYVEVSAETAVIELEKKAEIAQMVQHLGPPCKPILTLFYYQQYSTKTITETLNYKNEAVVRNMKSRCLKSLKAKMTQKLAHHVK